jgi:Trypsin
MKKLCDSSRVAMATSRFLLLLFITFICWKSSSILFDTSLEKSTNSITPTGIVSVFSFRRPCRTTQEYQFIPILQRAPKEQKRQHQKEVFLIDSNTSEYLSRRSLVSYEVKANDEASVDDSYSTKTTIRIVGGDIVTDINLYPFFAFPAGEELCGATLIHTDILLTAAHCLGAFIAHGALIGGTKIDSSQSQYVRVDREFPHPNYTKGTEENDIMLVRLSAFISTPSVTLNFNNQLPNDNDKATIIGFGFTSENGTFSEDLKETSVSVVPFEQCNEYFGDLNNETVICAGTVDGSSDSCRGDSGGPLFISASTASSDNINIQIGLVSFGDGCARPGIAAVYTRISAYEQWIKQGICDLSDNPPNDCIFTPTTAPPTISPIPTFYMPPIGTDTPTKSPTYRPLIQQTDIPTASRGPRIVVRPVPEEKSPRVQQKPINTMTSSNRSRKPQSTNSNRRMKVVERKKKSRKSSMQGRWKVKRPKTDHGNTPIAKYTDRDKTVHKIYQNSNNNVLKMVYRKSRPEGSQSETMEKEQHKYLRS